MKQSPTAPLPYDWSSKRWSAHGVDFHLYDDVWNLRNEGGRISINWTEIKPLIHSELEAQLREGFGKIVAVHTANTSLAFFKAMKSLLRTTIANTDAKHSIMVIDAPMLAQWIGGNPSSAYISQIKALFLSWRSLRGNGVDDEVFALSERMAIPSKGGGYATVLTWNEEEGPYRPTEDEAIRVALDDGFNEGIVSLDEYAFFRVLRGTGARTGSLADLKVDDLRKDGDRWFLRIPAIKQRGVVGWRVVFLPWKPISQGLASVLTMHIEANIRSPLDLCGLLLGRDVSRH